MVCELRFVAKVPDRGRFVGESHRFEWGDFWVASCVFEADRQLCVSSR
jgi:hypothetical protein